MAITKSAKKAHRASLKKRVFNIRRKRALTSTTKTVKKLVAAGDFISGYLGRPTNSRVAKALIARAA